MSVRLRNVLGRPALQTAPPAAIGGGSAEGDNAAPATVERSVFCSHGIHSGQFPVGGLTVREARRTLSHLLNIDPEAVAVISGQIVDEDQIIGSDTALLSFVKKSSVKGSFRMGMGDGD